MANIPPPMIIGGGRDRPNPLVSLLLSLAGSAGGSILSKLIAGPTQQDAAVNARHSLERTSSNELMGMPGTQEHAAVQAAAAGGAGNANVPTSQVPGLKALSAARGSAPERLGDIQQVVAAKALQDAETARQSKLLKERLDAEGAIQETRHARFIDQVRKQNPEHVTAAEMLWNTSGGTGNIDATALVQAGIMPQSTIQQIQESKAKVDLDMARVQFRQAAADEKLRQQVASKLGLPTVTDSMLTDFGKAANPDELATKLYLTYAAPHQVLDKNGFPTGQFDIMDPQKALQLTEAGVGQFHPGYKMAATTTKATLVATGLMRDAYSGWAKQGLGPAEIKFRMLDLWKQQGLPEDAFNTAFAAAKAAAAGSALKALK